MQSHRVLLLATVATIGGATLLIPNGTQDALAPTPRTAAVDAAPNVRNTIAVGEASPRRVILPLALPDPRTMALASKATSGGWIVDRATLSWMPPEFRLEEGDTILGINGEVLSSAEQVAEAIKGSSEGSAVEFHVRLAGTNETAVYSVAR